jgi:glycerophosphoryl diester phosphodiesterase
MNVMKITALLLLLFTASCMNAQNQLDIQGHRGARGLMPENSIPAFMRALEEGVTTLELDVVITKDKQVLVSHDPYMLSEICAKPDGSPVTKSEVKGFNIYQMTYAEVQGFDCGSRGNARFPEQQKMKTTKPLLSDLIDQVERYLVENNLPKVGYNIELKSLESEYEISQPLVDEFAELVLSVVTQKLENNRFTIQSFDFNVLKHINSNYPDEFCHTQGMKVIPWTVNTLNDMQQLANDGVDGIITDYPNLAKGLK